MISFHASRWCFACLLIRTGSAGSAALPLFCLILPLLATGCGKAHTEEKPGTHEEKRKKMGELTEEMRRVKHERDKLDEKLKELEHNFESIRTSSLTALIGYVREKDLTRDVQQPGRVVSYETTPIYTYIPGLVEKIPERHQHDGWFWSFSRQVDMGDHVKKNEILAVLFVPEREEDVLRKKAIVVQAKAELQLAHELLDTANKNVATTKAMIEEEKSVEPRIKAKFYRWKSEYERIQKLYDGKVIDKQVLDETLHQYDGAKGELGEVKAKIFRAEQSHLESISRMKRAEADVTVAETRIEVAQADQRESQRWFDYRYIRALFDGVLTKRTVNTGWLVKPVQGGEKGDPLFSIVRMDRMRVWVDVPEADAIYIKEGNPVRIRIQAQEFQNKGEIDATVTRISYALDETARTLRVEIELDNAIYNLRPEMYAYAYIPIVYKSVWTLPEQAIVQKEEQGSFIFREVDGKAVFTPVKLGIRASKEVQLLKYQEKPARPGAVGLWRDFTGSERIIMNPAGFVDSVRIEQFEPAP